MDGSDEQHPAIRGLKTVCRCNNIKYRTIERAIREGAWTLSQVAARTTATTGHCGGELHPGRPGDDCRTRSEARDAAEGGRRGRPSSPARMVGEEMTKKLEVYLKPT